MIGQLSADYQIVQNEEVKDAVLKMLGYFSVANLALGKELPADLPPETADLARQEYRLIENAAGKAVSPLFGYELSVYREGALYPQRGAGEIFPGHELVRAGAHAVLRRVKRA